jgi:hypothetical protein
MNHRALFPKPVTRVAMATALCALLGAIGCVTRPQAIMSTAGDVARMTATPFDPADNKCAEFSCQP